MKIGFLINPIAGLGGTVALKGTDGLAKQALELGAKPVAPLRAESFFDALDKDCSSEIKDSLIFFCPTSPMGEQILSKFAFNFKIIDLNFNTLETTAQDTINAVKMFEEEQVELIIFVGGDGTSVDIGKSIKQETPIIGIPSGVKTYGAVFAHTPEEAASVFLSFYHSKATNHAELLDLDEEQYKKGILSIQLLGYVTVPAFPIFFQHAKERIVHTESEEGILEGINDEIIEILNQTPSKKLLIIGPGTTFSSLFIKLQLSRSILGVDCIEFTNEKSCIILVQDAREDQIFSLLKKYKDRFVLVTPIGGMGYIFGRGNHQLSPRILKEIPKDHLLIASSSQKLQTIENSTLRVDTADETINASLIGYLRVITNYGETRMVKVIH